MMWLLLAYNIHVCLGMEACHDSPAKPVRKSHVVDVIIAYGVFYRLCAQECAQGHRGTQLLHPESMLRLHNIIDSLRTRFIS